MPSQIHLILRAMFPYLTKRSKHGIFSQSRRESQHGPRKTAAADQANDDLGMGSGLPGRRCVLPLPRRTSLAGIRDLPALRQSRSQAARHDEMELALQRVLALGDELSLLAYQRDDF